MTTLRDNKETNLMNTNLTSINNMQHMMKCMILEVYNNGRLRSMRKMRMKGKIF